jgi:UDPglucose--hexose-1-phosphate uridylyltransferase
MSEFREDPVTGTWRVVAEGRRARPNEYAVPVSRPAADPECPFCEGNESRTPPELAAIRAPASAPNGPGWSVRVIPNRFPTVAPVAPVAATAASEASATFRHRPGSGIHEVIVETPRHSPGLPYLDAPHRLQLFRLFRDRVQALTVAPRISAVLLFENWGPESGGTLWHPHVQLLATEAPARRLLEEAEAMRRRSKVALGGCFFETLIAAERASRERVVTSDDTFDVVAPFASEHPYEVWIVPRRHAPTFGDASDPEVDRLADLVPAVLRALDRIQPGISYNWYVHGLRTEAVDGVDFHWHVEVAPRTIRPDGFELGAGTSVNPVAPEAAAAALRQQLENDAP